MKFTFFRRYSRYFSILQVLRARRCS